jgi:phosphoglycerate dehydrogenase-like enzyme
MSSDLTILITADHQSDLPEKTRQIAPQARIVSREDIQRDPALLGQVRVVYGHVSPEELSAARGLRWLHSAAAGAEWTQRADVQAHPFTVTNSRIHGAQISETLFGMLLMLVRKLHQCYRNQLSHVWGRPDDRDIYSLPGRTLCVLGPGMIGQCCARLGKAHGMRVIAVRRRAGALPDVDAVYAIEQLNEALAQADVVMDLLPGGSGTRTMIGSPQFAAMRAGCLFFNAGRGSTVDTDALVAALRSGHLGGAGLDVVDPEPLPPEHPLWDMPNVILTPHCSGALGDYARLTDEVFLQNLRRFVRNEPLESVVDKQTGY